MSLWVYRLDKYPYGENPPGHVYTRQNRDKNRASHSQGKRAHIIVRGDVDYFPTPTYCARGLQRIHNDSVVISVYLLSNIRRGFRQAFPKWFVGCDAPKGFLLTISVPNL